MLILFKESKKRGMEEQLQLMLVPNSLPWHEFEDLSFSLPAKPGVRERWTVREEARVCFPLLKHGLCISCLKFNLIMHSLKRSDGDD